MGARDSSRPEFVIHSNMIVPPSGQCAKREPQFVIAGSYRSIPLAASKVTYPAPDKTLLDDKLFPTHV
jgi:hypothetical protein